MLLRFLRALFAGCIGWRIDYTDEKHEQVLAAIREDAERYAD